MNVASVRKLALVLAFVIALPVGYALASGEQVTPDEQSVEPTRAVEMIPPEDLPEPSPLPAGAEIPEDGPDTMPASSLPPSDEPPPVGKSMNQIGSSAPPERLVKACEAAMDSYPDCELVIAISKGDIEPGSYSDEELEQALKEAGYSGSYER